LFSGKKLLIIINFLLVTHFRINLDNNNDKTIKCNILEILSGKPIKLFFVVIIKNKKGSNIIAQIYNLDVIDTIARRLFIFDKLN